MNENIDENFSGEDFVYPPLLPKPFPECIDKRKVFGAFAGIAAGAVTYKVAEAVFPKIWEGIAAWIDSKF